MAKLMTPAELKEARGYLRLSQGGLAKQLGLQSKAKPLNGARTVARWESGESRIPGPVAVLVKLLLEHLVEWPEPSPRWHPPPP